MDDRTIKDLLDSAAPERPDLPAAARASAVRDRARVVTRRNRLALAAAVTAVVAGTALAVPLLGADGEPTGVPVAGDPAVTYEGSYDQEKGSPPPCSAEPVDVSALPPVEDLPNGAVSVRSCPAIGRPGETAQPEAGPKQGGLPTGPLTGPDADAFTRTVRGLPAYVLEDMCAMASIAYQPWAVVVSYPDGTTATLGAGSRACTPVRVAGVDRSAAVVLETLVANAVGS